VTAHSVFSLGARTRCTRCSSNCVATRDSILPDVNYSQLIKMVTKPIESNVAILSG